MNMGTESQTVDLDELRRLHDAATPGPWGWRGNDDGLVELRGHGPFGAYDGRVISAQRGEPCVASRSDGEVALTAEACDSCKTKWAEMLEQGHTDMWEDYRCPKPENLATVWLKGDAGIEPANRWAKRERPYRSDVAEVDHADAQLIVTLRNSLPALLNLVDAVVEMRPFGVTEKMHSLYCTICGAIEGAGDLHLRGCAWRMARESLGLDAGWPSDG